MSRGRGTVSGRYEAGGSTVDPSGPTKSSSAAVSGKGGRSSVYSPRVAFAPEAGNAVVRWLRHFDLQWVAAAFSTGVLVLLAARLPLNAYYLTLLTEVASYAVAALGLVVVLGYAGQISLAQASFFGVGSYAAALGTTKYHLDFWLAALIGIVLAAALGGILGVVSLKVGGHYLAMVTITFQLVFSLFLVNQLSFTGGPNGVTGIVRPNLGAIVLRSSQSYLVFCIVVLCVVGMAVWRLSTTRFGRAMRALRENELAAEVIGIPTYAVKVGSFVMSASLGAIGGALFACAFQFISPGDFAFSQSILFLTMVLLGGAQWIAGAVLGAGLVVFLPEWLRFLRTIYLAVYGAALVVFMIAAPGGIWGFLRGTWHRLGAASGRAPVSAIPLAFPEGGAPGDVALEVSGLVKHFGGVRACDGIDLDVRRGEVHALIGPNGSGKTTMLNVISGIYRPTQGSIRLGGRAISGLRPHQIAKLGVARTFQLIRLLKSETVLENVMVGAQVAPGSRASDLSGLAMGALEFVGMAAYADLPVVSLAYGHQRMVEIARALASGPVIVLLDEPGAGLNQTEKGQLVRLIRRLREESLTVILIEHDLELVRTVSDRLTVLNFGQKIADGRAEEVLQQAAVQAAYLGAVDGAA